MTTLRPAGLRPLLLTLFCLFTFHAAANAATLSVPAQYTTIQAAINAAQNGDTVLISDGAYTGPGNVDLDFLGKNITVTSVDGPSSTIINCQGTSSANHRGFYLHSGETSVVISGLTIQNGFVGGNGGGGSGGGIDNSSVGVTVQNCILKNNVANYGEGGGFYNGGTATLVNCALISNVASGRGGGGICNGFGGTLNVTNCTLIGNNTPNGYGGGLINFNDQAGNGTTVLTNDILYDFFYGGPSVEAYGAGITATFCDIQGGYTGTGNINADPLFVNAPTDLHLQSSSPCLGAGTQSGAPTATLDGRTRPTPPSVGAYEAALTGSVNTTTAVTSSLNPSAGGQSVTFTATVAIDGGIPEGTVNFSIDGVYKSSAALTMGQAAFSISSLTGGSHTVTAAYSGNATFAPSVSPPLTQTVNAATTTTAVISNLNPSLSGQDIFFSAQVRQTGAASPSGTITFTVDGVAGMPMPLNQGGTPGFSTSTLAVGSHTITAAYSGDANFAPSVSPILAQVVKAHISPQYISPSGSDSSDGSQAAPKLTIQAGINATLSGDTVVISDGTYTGPGNVDLDFGGRNISVISQNGAARTIIDCQGSSSANHRGFYLHSGERNAVISGLTIQDGYESDSGGGLYTLNVGVAVQNCILKNNRGYYGGGIENTNTINVALTLTNCTLVGNSATYFGGGIYDFDRGGSLTVTNCTLIGNSAGYSGGGIDNGNDSGGTFHLVNCVVAGNTAPYSGGVSNNNSNSNTGGTSLVTNCTFTGNSNGGLSNQNDASSTIMLVNDIFYGDTGGEVGGALATALNCDIQGGYAGTGNIDADPLFINAAVSDVHLQFGSPCTGAGTASGAPATDLDGRARPNPPSIGAYEGPVLAAAALTVTSVSGSPGQTVTLAAVLKKTSEGTAIAGKTLTFTVDGAVVGTAGTQGSGTARLSYVIPANAAGGSHPISVAFVGDNIYSAASGTGMLTVRVAAAPTTLTTAAVSGLPGQTVTLSAVLTRTADGAAVASKTVTFSLDGQVIGTAVSQGSGTARLSYAIPANATVGSHTLTVSFVGDSGFAASSGAGTLTVRGTAAAPTTLTVTAVSGSRGATVTLAAVLKKTSDGTAIAGKTLTFSVDGAVVGTAGTQGSGTARLSYVTPGNAAVGSHPVSVAFAGDSAYSAASGAGTLTVK